MATKQWDDPCYDLLEKIYDILVKEVNKILDTRFQRFQYGGLHHRVKWVQLFSLFVAFKSPKSVYLTQVDRERCALRAPGFSLGEDQMALGNGKCGSLHTERSLLRGLQGEIPKILSRSAVSFQSIISSRPNTRRTYRQRSI